MISFLLPSLFPALARRMIDSVQRGGYPDYEVVVCSPEPVGGPQVVWVADMIRNGPDPGIRHAYTASRGEVIAVLCDDHILLDGAVERMAREFFTEPDALWDMRSDWQGRIFGKLTAPFPMCSRRVVEECWRGFFPYHQHFGDCAFSLEALKKSVPIRRMSCQNIVYPWQDRLGCGESPAKNQANYEYGRDRIFADYPEYSAGWSRDPRVFNA